MAEFLFWALCAVAGAGSVIAWAWDRWYRHGYPCRWSRLTGLDPVTRLPVDRADQLVEQRRRQGVPPWASR